MPSKELVTGVSEQTPPDNLDPKKPHFVFKSKFKEDKVTLKKGEKTVYPDGTSRVQPAVMAEFNRFTWATDDEESAKILRDFIKERLRLGVPLHILETTNLEE